MKKMLCWLLLSALLFTAQPGFTQAARTTGIPTFGDLNADGTINAVDALTTLQAAVYLIMLDEMQEMYSDVNGDFFTDASDALEILQYSVKRIDCFTAKSYEDYTIDFDFEGKITRDNLCSYLSRAVTISQEPWLEDNQHIKEFILDTGAKYICRAATTWVPSLSDYETFPIQQEFIRQVHAQDPQVVFEACIFESITQAVNEIAVPEYVFTAFNKPVEQRNFSFDAMVYPNGNLVNQWGTNHAVPDITQEETKMFFYFRACEYIKLGYEALHMGQVHLMGQHDSGYRHWTDLLAKIRAYAAQNARRKFVFINAHTHGIIGADGNLLFDFHMYPSRPSAIRGQAHQATEDNPQRARFDGGHIDSIYGKSMGGTTYSGWSCTSLPYLVELDNYGCDKSKLNKPIPNDQYCWGMDEISWFANQPDWYRAQFLRYAYDYVTYMADGDGFFAMPGERVASYFNQHNIAYAYRYYGYNTSTFAKGSGDQQVIKEIWQNP